VKRLRELTAGDRPRLAEQLAASWGSTRVASRGRLHEATDLPGFIALDGERWLGYSAYEIVGSSMEVVVLDSPMPARGAGSALIAACADLAVQRGLERLWLVTTNDNLQALRFYQRRGFVLVVLRPGAIDEARRTLKPEIPTVGLDEIPVRDELELELPRHVWPGLVERYRWPSI
jgi:DNA-3-methyladenine glycosylase I